ncbi:chitin deacetylase [Podila epigama]|nr:chitin deacetylase [Podila epigama]
MVHKFILSALALAALTFPSVSASPVPRSFTEMASEPVTQTASGAKALTKRAGSAATIITTCTVDNSFAVTFDDGPGTLTHKLLDYLKDRGVKVTFFVNGDNYNNILDKEYSAVVKRAFDEGHQIGSHTWSHANLQASSTNIDQEMTKLDQALKTIIGKRPVYMRPPYGNTSPAALEYLGSHGYKVVNWNVDTEDWRHPKAFDVNLAAYKAAIQNPPASRRFISLQHDAEADTAGVFGKMAIEYVLDKGYDVMPVGTCLGDTTGWYRD